MNNYANRLYSSRQPGLICLFALALFCGTRQAGFVFIDFGLIYLLALAAYFVIISDLKNFTNRQLFILAALAGGLRCLFILQEPRLSDDLFRCLWEGLVVLDGHNPYQLAPSAAELEHLRPIWYELINHPRYPAIYPPLALVFNTLVAAIKANPAFYKFSLTLVETILVGVIVLRLKKLGRARRECLVYFLHPLAIIEISGNGHLEPLIMLPAMLAFYFLDSKREKLAAAAFSAAFLGKYFFLVMIREFNLRRLLPILLGLTILVFIPFIDLRGDFLFSLKSYLRHWDFNASLYRLGTLIITDHNLLRLLLGSAYLLFWILVYQRQTLSRLQRPVWLLGGLLLAAPTVHPWYGLWLLPFLVFYRPPAIWLTVSLLPLSYIVLERFQADGIWRENYWITGLIYSPLLVAAAGRLMPAGFRRGDFSRRLKGIAE